MNDAAAMPPAPPAAARRATWRFLLANPLHVIALGFGSGLAPRAPGTVGTLWAWAAFLILRPYLDDAQWAALIVIGFGLGCWASAVTARHLGKPDPGCVVWDEVIAFWIVLWLVTPASLLAQTIAFALFRLFDAAKPGPVGFTDRCFKPRRGASGEMRIGLREGLGIMLDDLVAALCTLLVIAAWRFVW
ncbi:MAG TPA: phosphatidylglycerophosphatase A [Burkholderiaceae bacterium]|nr:phosphatidylglycerophosphatase A [Burkholderiaceae bacterium]